MASIFSYTLPKSSKFDLKNPFKFFSYIMPVFSTIIEPNWTVQNNIHYGPNPEQTADLYLLDNDKENPTMIFIHGGGWAAGDKGVYSGRAKKYALAGFNVISLNYTLATTNPSTQWPVQLTDVQLAFNWIKHNASQWGIDTNRIAVGGDSAGGHLALWLGLEANVVLNMVGPCDLTQPSMQRVMVHLDVFNKQSYEENPQLYIDASPIFKMTQNYPPTFIVHAPDDEMVPFSQAEVLDKRLTQLGVYHKLMTYTGGHDLNKIPSSLLYWIDLKGLWFILDNV